MMRRAGALVAAGLLLSAASVAAGPAEEEAKQHLGACLNTSNEQFCEATQKTFVSSYAQALSGTYLGLKNVAACLQSGCDGAVEKNVVFGCAWQLVLLASGDPHVGDLDVEDFNTFCRKPLSPDAMATARARAGAIFTRIYGREFPTGF